MHSVFVVSKSGKPLTPTTPARARKLLKVGVAKKAWSKFGTFGIQLLVESGSEVPLTTLGYDAGTKFEGFAVVCGNENVLAIKLDLPDKQKIVRKMEERHNLRRTRRFRNTRRRPARFDNRRKSGWIAPSQLVIVQARLKLLAALFAIYPIARVGFEDVRFNRGKHKWGANFSTIEIGKTRIKNWIAERARLTLYRGWQTSKLREHYGYRKSKARNEDTFTAHCTDALALACEVGIKERVEPGRFLVVDDTYRLVRRKLHDTQPAKGGVRQVFTRGTVLGLRKGLLIGARNGKNGQLCGGSLGRIRYYDVRGIRQDTRLIKWISTQFMIRHTETTLTSQDS